VLVFGLSLHSFGLVPTIAWNATTTIGAENTTGIKDMRVKEGDNIF
jgi:5-enolpyruvylshikimate-3-phosphate synthase